MDPMNLLVIMSDQHNPKALGHAGHPVARTPHLDAMAENGTQYTAAYTHSPLCMPARATFATGRYVHDIRAWNNAQPYDGSIPSWAHRLRDAGHRVESIGKLHFRSEEDDYGFTATHMPMHAVAGLGDLMGCIRDELPLRPNTREVIEKAGRAASSYTRYDDRITAATVAWLREAANHDGKPWVLFCSMVCPHPPKLAPPEFFDLYPLEDVPWPVEATADDGWTMHPATADFRRAFRWDTGFTEAQIRTALAAYLGQISFLDGNIGKVLDALEVTGLARNTRVIYTTDHGDNMGNRGLWNKNALYDDAARVPFIVQGPDLPVGEVVDEPISHLDCFPTILEMAGCAPHEQEADLPGESFTPFIGGSGRSRPALLSQFHGSGSSKGVFTVRTGKLKYIYHAGWPAQLFDLSADPDECIDLAADPTHDGALTAADAALRSLCDPDAIDAEAHLDQAALVDAHGGKEALMARGTYAGSPVHGETATFNALGS
ncbi:MAG: sulfatase-like hydrolase/transferase [Pseudomonadota bacterium]